MTKHMTKADWEQFAERLGGELAKADTVYALIYWNTGSLVFHRNLAREIMKAIGEK